MRELIYCDTEKCSGCGICELTCSGFHEKAYNPKNSRVRVVRLDLLSDMAVTCRFCEDPPCVSSCPRDALKQTEETGLIRVDETKCNGCGWCVEACEFGAIALHTRKGTALVCDLCSEEQDEKKKPRCVKACPKEALSLTTTDAFAARKRFSSVASLPTQIKTIK